MGTQPICAVSAACTAHVPMPCSTWTAQSAAQEVLLNRCNPPGVDGERARSPLNSPQHCAPSCSPAGRGGSKTWPWLCSGRGLVSEQRPGPERTASARTCRSTPAYLNGWAGTCRQCWMGGYSIMHVTHTTQCIRRCRRDTTHTQRRLSPHLSTRCAPAGRVPAVTLLSAEGLTAGVHARAPVRQDNRWAAQSVPGIQRAGRLADQLIGAAAGLPCTAQRLAWA